MSNPADFELRRQSIQRHLDSQKTPRQRNILGQFATPYPLALEVVQYVRKLRGDQNLPLRFLEPALGTGGGVFFRIARGIP